MGIEFLTNRDSRGNQTVGGNARLYEFRFRNCAGNEISIQIAVFQKGRGGVVRSGKKAGFLADEVLPDFRHHQRGKQVDADNRVVIAFYQNFPQLPGAQRQQLIDRRNAVLRIAGIPLKDSVARIRKLGGVFVEPGVPVADEFGKLGRQAGQNVFNTAFHTPGFQNRDNGLCRGVVTLTGIAGQKENPHPAHILSRQAYFAYHIRKTS